MTTENRATEIRIKMMRKKVRPIDISRSFDPPVSHTAVLNVIKGKSVSMRIKKAIAKAVGSTVEELWPDDDEKDRAA